MNEHATDAEEIEESSTSEVAETPEESTTSEEKEEKVNMVPQDRLNQVWHEKKTAEREAAALRAENEELKQKQKPAEAPVKTGIPRIEDFDYDQDAFNEAFINHKVKESVESHEMRRVQEDQQKQAKIKAGEFQSRALEYAKDNPDYVKTYKTTGGVIYGDHVLNAVFQEGPQLDHYLLKNPMEVDRLNNLDPVSAGVEIGKISASFKAPAKKKISNAPPAIDPVSGTGAVTSDPRYDPNISPEDYYKWSMGKKGG